MINTHNGLKGSTFRWPCALKILDSSGGETSHHVYDLPATFISLLGHFLKKYLIQEIFVFYRVLDLRSFFFFYLFI